MHDNHVVLAGHVRQAPQQRYSPAGIAITQLTLQHDSARAEAGMSRQVRCSIRVVAAGDPIAGQAAGLTAGTPIRVHGFLAWASERNAPSLVLHAERIESLTE